MKITMMVLALATVMSTMLGCSHKGQIKEVNDQIDVRGKLGDKDIGIDENDKAVIQESIAVEDELRTMTWKNYEADRKLKSEREQLTTCRTDLADPRLGGNKQIEAVPAIEVTENQGKVDEKMGVASNGQIKLVKRTMLEEKLENQKQYNESLNGLLTTVSQSRENCERELGYARVAKGLPAERYTAQGHYGPEGNFIVNRKAEHNLDDAFRIRGMESQVAEETK